MNPIRRVIQWLNKRREDRARAELEEVQAEIGELRRDIRKAGRNLKLASENALETSSHFFKNRAASLREELRCDRVRLKSLVLRKTLLQARLPKEKKAA